MNNTRPTTTWTELRAERMTSPEAQAGYETARLRAQLGERVRELRVARGLSQASLARVVGASPAAIERLELGGSEPSLTMLQALCRALGSHLEVTLRDASGS